VVLTSLALLAFLGGPPLYKKLTLKQASSALIERTRNAVDKHPELKPDYDKAIEGGVLSYDEAKKILEKAGETVRPDE
jgi:hypothetical protein